MTVHDCDDIEVSHRYVVKLVETIVMEDVLPAMERTGKARLGDRDFIVNETEEEFDWIRAEVEDAVRKRCCERSKIASIMTGTCIRIPSQVFGPGSALYRHDWFREIAMIAIDRDCFTQQRILATLQITAEVIIELFALNILKFQKRQRTDKFEEMATRLLRGHEKILGENYADSNLDPDPV